MQIYKLCVLPHIFNIYLQNQYIVYSVAYLKDSMWYIVYSGNAIKTVGIIIGHLNLNLLLPEVLLRGVTVKLNRNLMD